jgi:hypothetical protein
MSYFNLLSPEELIDVMHEATDCEKSKLCIAARSVSYRHTPHVELLLADGKTWLIPQHVFRASGCGTTPNFSEPCPIDHGQTLQLGKYEACVETLFEHHIGV